MYATNVCRRDGDVLSRTNTLEDELHTRVPLLLVSARNVFRYLYSIFTFAAFLVIFVFAPLVLLVH